MNLDVARTQMLGQQLRAWEVLSDRVLAACGQTPREQFVPDDYRELAFADIEIPLQHGQCMLAPKMEGRVLQALEIEPIDDVLVIGTGSGYLTACAAKLAKRVVSVDIFPDFVSGAELRLGRHGVRNVELKAVDALTLSLAGQFDAVAITASLPTVDERFVEMLRPQGRLFVVVGEEPAMEAQLITRGASGSISVAGLFETVLTPMINARRPEPFQL